MTTPLQVHETVGYQILKTLRTYGTMPLAEAVKLHGNFGMTPQRLKGEYTRLENRRLIALVGAGFFITPAGERYVSDNDPNRFGWVGPVTPFPTPMPFRPLSRQYIPSTTGTRPEADFWRTVPSRMTSA